jgi:hypothetical protein
MDEAPAEDDEPVCGEAFCEECGCCLVCDECTRDQCYCFGVLLKDEVE